MPIPTSQGYSMVHLLLVIPVTSANVERANPSLLFIKTDLRSTSQSCLKKSDRPSPAVHRSLNTPESPSCGRSFRKITASPVALSQSSCQFLKRVFCIQLYQVGTFQSSLELACNCISNDMDWVAFLHCMSAVRGVLAPCTPSLSS